MSSTAAVLADIELPDGGDWKQIAKSFPIYKSDILNLNSGSAGNMPRSVERAHLAAIQDMNRAPAYEVKDAKADLEARLMVRLARLMNADSSELILMRNTTDALNTVIEALDVGASHVLYAGVNDYPYAYQAMRARGLRDDVAFSDTTYDIEVSDEALIEHYDRLLTRPGILLLTHMSHRTGRVLPIKEITAIAHARDITVIVDGAHSYAHTEVNVKDLNCDYYATSLHKWLCAPLGSGLLYVRSDRLSGLRARSSANAQSNTIIKLGYEGTHDFYRIAGIWSAMDFLESIGGLSAKRTRLVALTQYWSTALKSVEDLAIHSYPGQIAIGNLSSTRYKTWELKDLLAAQNIHCKIVGRKGLSSRLRISTNLFMTEKELDRFIEVLAKHHS